MIGESMIRLRSGHLRMRSMQNLSRLVVIALAATRDNQVIIGTGSRFQEGDTFVIYFEESEDVPDGIGLRLGKIFSCLTLGVWPEKGLPVSHSRQNRQTAALSPELHKERFSRSSTCWLHGRFGKAVYGETLKAV